jgi:outer membrane murein-binding lipoprotein Lpp
MRRNPMQAAILAAALLLAGCADLPVANAPLDQCKADVARLNEQLAAQAAERQRSTRAAARREESLRRQLDAMKSIVRGILEREDRMRTEAR